MTTIWRKFRAWPTWAQATVAGVLVLLAIAAGSGSGSGGKDSAKPQAAKGVVTTASTLRSRPTYCIAATRTGTPAKWAVKYTDRAGEWALASPSGGIWMTNIDPAGPDAAGLTLPLNSAARAESEMGVDVTPGAPIYKGAKASDRAALQAVECAQFS